MYNQDNVFYKIINNQIPSDPVMESKYFIAINDISPKAPTHVLIIPKNSYIDYYDFITNAKDEEIVDVNKGIAKLIEVMGLVENGYRIVTNSKLFGQQEIMHVHFHLMG